MLARIKKMLEGVPKEYLAGVDTGKLEFYRGQGCAHCGDLGYRGRVAVSEVVTITSELRDIINRSGSRHELEDELKNQKFITLTQDCLIKALQGVTTLDEVMRVSQL